MVSARPAAALKGNKATQTDLLQRRAAVQVRGCTECPSLLQEDGKDSSCVRCEHDLTSLVAELQEEVERLRSIWECEKEMGWWSHTLPSLGKKEQEEAAGEVEDPLPSCPQAEGGAVGEDEGERRQVPVQGSRRVPSRPPPPSQVPVQNRYKPLETEDEGMESTDKGLSRELLKQPAPCIKTASVTLSCLKLTSDFIKWKAS
ncbi:death-associated protein 1 [Limosa lapponica baueri]|uniref:Death-associated protein 1 n=1 Tax=Limosa lapponica baueri TaxID=1758121 RepID=A0A2I0THI3_LIMLA|nr:death-associated protein 1 [Limosa lapponica baueri]